MRAYVWLHATDDDQDIRLFVTEAWRTRAITDELRDRVSDNPALIPAGDHARFHQLCDEGDVGPLIAFWTNLHNEVFDLTEAEVEGT